MSQAISSVTRDVRGETWVTKTAHTFTKFASNLVLPGWGNEIKIFESQYKVLINYDHLIFFRKYKNRYWNGAPQ